MPTPSVTRIPTMAAAFARNPYIKAPWKASDFTILDAEAVVETSDAKHDTSEEKVSVLVDYFMNDNPYVDESEARAACESIVRQIEVKQHNKDGAIRSARKDHERFLQHSRSLSEHTLRGQYGASPLERKKGSRLLTTRFKEGALRTPPSGGGDSRKVSKESSAGHSTFASETDENTLNVPIPVMPYAFPKLDRENKKEAVVIEETASKVVVEEEKDHFDRALKWAAENDRVVMLLFKKDKKG